MSDKIILFSTCESEADARRIAAELVGRGLAACVNIVPGVTSVYRWKGAVETAGEWLLIIKSRKDLTARIEQAFATIHPYEVPELLAVPVAGGGAAYLGWLDGALLPDET